MAREIHRRSIWQVLGAFLVLSWLVLGFIDFLTLRVGLPAWTPGMAFVLLLIGLPIVVATAVVQEGIPWLRIPDLVDPNELEGLTPEQVLVVPEEHPMHGVALFTWRNAILGGVMAGALLATSVVAYLSMWALGIGPLGSLIAQGVLDPNDSVILADFVDGTGDERVGSRVAEVFGTHLARSSVVTILDRDGLAGALQRMGHSESEALGRQAALELAAQEEVKAVVQVEVTMVGDHYRVSASILNGDGTQLARFRENAETEDELGPVAERLSAKLREKFGESIQSIRATDEAAPGA